jgi:hypothetical protein
MRRNSVAVKYITAVELETVKTVTAAIKAISKPLVSFRLVNLRLTLEVTSVLQT